MQIYLNNWIQIFFWISSIIITLYPSLSLVGFELLNTALSRAAEDDFLEAGLSLPLKRKRLAAGWGALPAVCWSPLLDATLVETLVLVETVVDTFDGRRILLLTAENETID